jgi:hypothetical protein
MSHLSRRQLLAGFLGGLVPAAGTVVLARAVLSGTVAEAREVDASSQSPASFQERADRVAAEQGPLGEGEDLQPVAYVNGGGFRKGGFANGGFGNGGGGGFRKGGFANGGGGGGGFRNGGFGNGGGGGGFRKGGFANGGGGGGGFRNGGFANGGGGGGFRNGAFRNF